MSYESGQSEFHAEPTELPLLERDEPLTALESLLAAAAVGAGHVVAISGEAGVGKTSLVRRFARTLPDDAIFLHGDCEDLGTARPLGPLFDMLDRLDAEVAATVTGDAGYGDVFTALHAWLKRQDLAVMIVEDVHWADSATLDMIRFLGRRIASLPLLLLVTFRSDEPESDLEIARALGNIGAADLLRIELEPLSENAVGTLAAMAGRTAEGLHAATAGNPFFVTEILASQSAAGATLPASVRHAVWARIARYSEASQAMMKMLALMPGGASREQLAELVGEEAAAHIEPALQGQVLVEHDGARLTFRHALARLAVQALVPAHTRRAWHLEIAQWYARRRPQDDLAAAAARLYHANAGDDAEQVIALAPQLARHAGAVGAHRQAAQFLATALRFAERMDDATLAQTCETWSYESGLAERIDAEVIEARLRAIRLWERLGNVEKVGLNHRWLARLYWYFGDAAASRRHLAEAIQLLESIEPCEELAWSYSARSQTAMLNDRFDEAIEWGERALALAERLALPEVRVHSLNNVGTSLLFTTDPERGIAMMEESLAISLAHGFHEQAARVYTNLAEYGISIKDLPFAERYLDAGIEFDTDNDLDSWLHYLRGCRAQALLLRGEHRAAREVADAVLALAHITPVMKMGAALVRALVDVRTEASAGLDELTGLLDEANRTEEPQRIIPALLALAEACWIAGDLAQCAEHAEAAWRLSDASKPWERGDIACWLHRAGAPVPHGADPLPEPVRLELAGQWREAAEAWQARGIHYTAALVVAASAHHAGAAVRRRVTRDLRQMGAEACLAAVTRHQPAGGAPARPRARRGPYRHSRSDRFGLTAKERVVLDCLCEGISNREIAERLNRSVRTVEHHVSSIIDKMDVDNRRAAILIAIQDRTGAD